ncbi:polysaccharide biosynthesis/export family protein [Subsaxibacter sp. CAU 1640]|uniref:polysaccharide biosynthesis/export family protein n=1 Tax=Subsaxibacter sp. CAU 1640 TaxID=2933271 RepID=UPI002002CF89|nr:polysaccharide biosynthesis/export family protein [Subsaxibacter sp. CAU 1640]MCK7590217.1 polysaccharide biosynthesis/export family protein [Subsaxibacter sp. CAU 1640]
MKHLFIVIIVALFFNSCANKKEILYLQDADNFNNSSIKFSTPKIQPNDILKITVGALESEAAIPYNKISSTSGPGNNIELMKLEGYLVSEDHSIDFPQLGQISTYNKSVIELQEEIKNRLETSGHLKNPTVNVRLLNAKVTVLGEVRNPGTFSFTEQNITLLQVLGLAGDLTINGKREDILVMRETDSLRQISHIDMTSAELLNSPFYNIKPNDVIIVSPNEPKVKSAGFVGNTGTLISVISILLTTIVLITR